MMLSTHGAARTFLALVMFCGTVAPATAQRAPDAPLSTAQRRALLTDPTRAFWKSKAPDTVSVDVETSKGTMTVELIREWSPAGVDRFYNLVRAGFYDDTRFYRVLPYYIAQFGMAASPAIDGVWRGRKLRADTAVAKNERGTLTFAQNTPKDRSTTLFFNLRDNPTLDSLHFTPVGRITSGLEVADSLYGGYAEIPTSPPPIGNPRRFYAESNRFLDKEYPKLDRIITIKVRQPPNE